jgi:guanylate kinase
LKKGKLIIFSAPSGAGKTTLVHHLLEKNIGLEFSVSATSREKRVNEIHGKDYYFLFSDEFRKKISNNDFVEWEEVYPGQFYGTLKSEIERIWEKGNHVIFDVDVVGGLNLKKKFADKALAIFVMPPSAEALADRLKKRGTETTEKINMRIAKANQELGRAAEFDAIIVNDDLQKAVKEAEEIVRNFLL